VPVSTVVAGVDETGTVVEDLFTAGADESTTFSCDCARVRVGFGAEVEIGGEAVVVVVRVK
jgi:hypothetical protein